MTTDAPAAPPADKLIGGKYTEKAIRELAQVVHDIWCKLHRAGRSRRIHRAATERILGMTGIGVIGWMHLVNVMGGEKGLKHEEAVKRLVELMSDPGRISTVGRDLLDTVSMLCNRMMVVRLEASSHERYPDYDERKAIWRGYDELEAAFLALTSCQILTELTNTRRIRKTEEPRFIDLAKTLIAEHHVLSQALGSGSFGDVSVEKLGQARGSRLFEGIRAQERSEAKGGVKGLSDWMRRPSSRQRRGLPADIAHGIHELTEIDRDLRFHAWSMPSDIRDQRLRAAQIVRITVERAIGTGILIYMPI